MLRRTLLLGSATILLSACSNSETAEEAVSADIAEAPSANFGFAESGPEGGRGTAADVVEQAAGTASNQATDTTIPTGQPQIAYRYALGFRLPADAIKPLQERHADMCEAMGRDSCRIVSMRQADQDGDYSYGNLQLAVASAKARQFSKDLEAASGKVDGEMVSSSIDGEDLSKRIVDTEARLRARTVLRDRLMEVLRTRKGTVAELVEAERGVAQVNEEIDQAKSWLAEMRGRVAFSQMQITYESGTRASGGFMEPIREAFGSIGAILGTMIAFLIIALTILLPIGVLVWLARATWKRSGMRLPRRKSQNETSKG